MQKLISFIIPTRRFHNLQGFFDNLEATTADLTCLEVLIKFDEDQEGVVEFIEAEKNKRPFTIKYVITPRIEGVFSIWVGMEQLFFMTDENSYFIQILSDEPRFLTQHWDKVLRNYLGFFADDVFRLRLSVMKFANYSSHYECTFRPDSFPIYTRRWLELTEGTGDCWGSDAYQQCVAFQLSMGPGSYTNYYREHGLCRDVTVYDIKLGGLEFGVGVTGEEQRERHRRNLIEWARLTSFQMQEHFSYLARRINCYVFAKENEIEKFRLVKNALRKTVAVVSDEGKVLMEMTYAVPRLVVYSQNAVRYLVLLPRRIMVGLLTIIGPIRLEIYKLLGIDINKKYEIKNTGISFKRKVKNFILKALSYLYIPINLLMGFVDKLSKASPPGISIISDGKHDVPRGIKPPSQAQIDWLKTELQRQSNKKSELTDRVFSMKNTN